MDSVDLQAPQAATWARLHLEYIQVARALAAAHDGCVHPQRRPAIYTAMLAALGRMLEVLKLHFSGAAFHARTNQLQLCTMSYVRSWTDLYGCCLQARAVLDGISVGAVEAVAAAALELRLTPAACEVPLPRCFRADRQQVIRQCNLF